MSKQDHAKQSDWNTQPMPNRTRRLRINVKFTPSEMQAIQKGIVPREMEDKWFIFYEDGVLHMHRSWTGLCLYRIQFDKTADGCVATQVTINDDPDEYQAENDERELDSVRALINILLLGRYEEYPTDSPGSDASVLQQWSVLGRAMFPVNDDEEKDSI